MDVHEIHAEAHKAGMIAGADCRPTPMIVGKAKDLFSNEIDFNHPVFRVDDGTCGFAWVCFKGNSAFGRAMKAARLARAHYPSGLCVWVSEFGQSVERKEAYAVAYAGVLKAKGIDAYAGSRMD